MSYLGSKAGSSAHKRIIAMMPKHDVYIEAFLGSGVIMRDKPPSIKSIGIDIDRCSIDLFNYEVPNLELINGDAFKFLDEYDYASAETFVYLDPPYLLSTRSSKARYNFEISEQQHIELIELIKSKNCKFMISGYPSKLYDDLLADLKTVKFQSMTRGGLRTEQLWWNYDEFDAFTHKFAGRDFTHRQQIKRKAERWAKNFKKLSQAEQMAILNKILELE